MHTSALLIRSQAEGPLTAGCEAHWEEVPSAGRQACWAGSWPKPPAAAIRADSGPRGSRGVRMIIPIDSVPARGAWPPALTQSTAARHAGGALVGPTPPRPASRCRADSASTCTNQVSAPASGPGHALPGCREVSAMAKRTPRRCSPARAARRRAGCGPAGWPAPASPPSLAAPAPAARALYSHLVLTGAFAVMQSCCVMHAAASIAIRRPSRDHARSND
jgi:hypothetical protein